MASSLVRHTSPGALDPWRMMDEMERRMWDIMNTPLGFTPLNRIFGRMEPVLPPMNMYETEDDVLVFASLPGINANTVTIQSQNNNVTISGEQQPVLDLNASEGVTVHLTGITDYGKFSFSFTLPCEVDSGKAAANYQNGILRLQFPKSAKAKPIKIAIHGENNTPIITSGDNK